MRRKPRKPDKEKYVVTIKDVSAESRYIFNTLCRTHHRETPAEIFDRMARAELDQTYGEGHAEVIIRDYRNRQK